MDHCLGLLIEVFMLPSHCRTAAIAFLFTCVITAQATASDSIAIEGCVSSTPPAESKDGPRHLVWSEDGAVLKDASVRSQGETGPAAVLYWLDDEDDLKAYVGRRVEVIGRIGDEYERGTIELEEDDGFVEITVGVDGEDAKARIPRWMFRRNNIDDFTLHVLVRRVDVEKVRLISDKACE